MTASDRVDPLANAAAASWVDAVEPPADVLGEALRNDLTAWVALLIPADDRWPSASAVGAGAYVEQVAARVPAFLAELIGMLVQTGEPGRPFAELPSDIALGRMRVTEIGPWAATFRRVYELTCEQYYRAPAVIDVVRERTGFDSIRPTVGAELDPFDASRLDRVRRMPLRFPERAR